MLKIIFLGTPQFASNCLAHLVERYGRPVAVVTQVAKPTGRGQKLLASPVESYARDNGIPLFSTSNINEPSLVEKLRGFSPDLLLIVAFGQLLKSEILSVPRLFCLNVHASLLPEYRGAAPIQRSLLDGKTKTGVSIQKIVKKLDAGDVLLQESLDILPNETSGELSDRLSALGSKALVAATKQVESGDYSFTPQDEKQATYAHKIDRTLSPIDWGKAANMIHNQVRALHPWPIAETTLEGKRLMIHRAILESENRPGAAGEILTDGKNYLKVICGDNRVLTLTEIQAENKKKIDAKQFLAAYRGNFPCRKFGGL